MKMRGKPFDDHLAGSLDCRDVAKEKDLQRMGKEVLVVEYTF